MSLPAVRPGMNERITSVTAYTTLDLVDGAALGHDWTENGSGVLNVTASDERPDRVELQFELDASTSSASPTTPTGSTSRPSRPGRSRPR